MVLKRRVTSAVQSKMNALEMNGRRISSNGNVWYYAQTKSYWKIFSNTFNKLSWARLVTDKGFSTSKSFSSVFMLPHTWVTLFVKKYIKWVINPKRNINSVKWICVQICGLRLDGTQIVWHWVHFCLMKGCFHKNATFWMCDIQSLNLRKGAERIVKNFVKLFLRKLSFPCSDIHKTGFTNNLHICFVDEVALFYRVVQWCQNPENHYEGL